MSIRERLSGNEAVAYAMRQINPDVFAAFPITPSTEIPQYFHTAYLFSPFFEYIDPEMAALFRAMKQDLLPAQPTKEDITRLSFEFENGRITRNGELYLWPTEMQGFALSHEVAAQIRLSDNRRDSGVFSRKD